MLNYFKKHLLLSPADIGVITEITDRLAFLAEATDILKA